MRYYYQYVLGIYPRDETIPIQTGNAGHFNLEQFFKAIADGATKEEALEKMIPVNMSPHALKACALATQFCMKFNINSGKPILVEEAFVVPLQGGVKMGLRPDLVWEFNSGKQGLFDAKFTGRSWSDEGAEQHYQLPAYQHYLNTECGYHISTLNYIFFNTRDNAQGEHKFRIKTFTISPEEAATVSNDQIKALDKVLEFRENPASYTRLAAKRINNVHVCTYCPFKMPCRFERKGKDATGVLAIQYTSNTYGYGEDSND